MCKYNNCGYVLIITQLENLVSCHTFVSCVKQRDLRPILNFVSHLIKFLSEDMMLNEFQKLIDKRFKYCKVGFVDLGSKLSINDE